MPGAGGIEQDDPGERLGIEPELLADHHPAVDESLHPACVGFGESARGGGRRCRRRFRRGRDGSRNGREGQQEGAGERAAEHDSVEYGDAVELFAGREVGRRAGGGGGMCKSFAAFREAAEKLRAGDREAAFPVGSFPPGLPFVTA